MLNKLGVRGAFIKNWCTYHSQLHNQLPQFYDVTYFTLHFSSCDVSFHWSSTPEGGDFWNGVCLALNCVLPALEPIYKRTVLLLKKRKYVINFDDDFVKSMSKTLEKNSSKMQLTTILLGGSIRDFFREHILMTGAVIDSKEMASAISVIAKETINKGYFIRKKEANFNCI